MQKPLQRVTAFERCSQQPWLGLAMVRLGIAIYVAACGTSFGQATSAALGQERGVEQPASMVKPSDSDVPQPSSTGSVVPLQLGSVRAVPAVETTWIQVPAHRDMPTRTKVPASLAAFTMPVATPMALQYNSVATPEVIAWLKQMIRDNLPPVHEDDRKWNQQKEVWDGVKIWREGGRLETKRKKKLVNHGTWTRYRIAIVDPDETLHIQFHRLEPLPNGPLAFHVTVDCSLDVFGRMSKWVRDVQVISLSANADAACRLSLLGTVDFQMNLLKLPPDIKIKPHVDQAHVDLTYYRVRRISQVGGDWAKVMGKGLRRVVDDKVEDMNGKLVDKINKQLEKHSKKLEFSPQVWLRSKLPLPATTSADQSAQPPASPDAG